MKSSIFSLLALISFSIAASAQQKTNGYPAYDNVHLEHQDGLQKLSKINRLAHLENNATTPSTVMYMPLGYYTNGFSFYKPQPAGALYGNTFPLCKTGAVYAAQHRLYMMPVVKPVKL